MPSISASPTEEDESDSGDKPSYYRIVGTMEPTLCPDRKMSPFVKTEGGESCPVLFSDNALPVVVEKTTMDTVTVKLANTFPSTTSLTALAMTFPDASGKTKCNVLSKTDVGAMSEPMEAKCGDDGFVKLEVFATSPGFKGEGASATKPASCSAIKNKVSHLDGFIFGTACSSLRGLTIFLTVRILPSTYNFRTPLVATSWRSHAPVLRARLLRSKALPHLPLPSPLRPFPPRSQRSCPRLLELSAKAVTRLCTSTSSPANARSPCRSLLFWFLARTRLPSSSSSRNGMKRSTSSLPCSSRTGKTFAPLMLMSARK